MAPRTPTQQIAYNEKRRTENAARKATEAAPARKPAAAKEADKTVDRAPVVSRTGRGHEAMEATKEARVNAKLKATAKALRARIDPSPFDPQKMHDVFTGKRKANAGKIAPVNIELKARAKRVAKEVGVTSKKAIAVAAAVTQQMQDETDTKIARKRLAEPTVPAPKWGDTARKLGVPTRMDAPVTVTVGAGTPSMHTMARSYLRSGAPGLGKLRGSTYQATVSFTPAQMSQVVEAAKFRGVSLAEMIRSAVVEHLNKGM